MKLSVKNQTLVSVTFILLVACSFLVYMVYKQEEAKFEHCKKIYGEKINYAYTKVLTKYEKFYASRIMANLRSQGVKEALENLDKTKLNELVKGRWEVLKSENEHLKLMQFYLSDSKVFLKMNNTSSHMNESALYRAMIRDVNQKKLPIHGFEEDESMLAYRIIYPILHNNRLLGALELGLSPEFLLNEIFDFYQMQTVLYVKESNVFEVSAKLGGYYQKYNTLENKSILKYMPREYKFEPFISLESKDKSYYGVYSIDVQDFSSNNVAKLLFFIDLTTERNEMINNIATLAIILFGLAVVVLFLINVLFNRNIRILEKEYENMIQYKKMIDEHVITACLDLNCNILNVSEAFLEISGYQKSFLLGQKYRILVYPDMQNDMYEKIYKALKYKKNFQGEVKKVKENGEFFWVYVNIQPHVRKNVLTGYEVIMHDITDKKINEELMVRDGLTHIYNRRHFNDVFPRMIQSTKRDGGLLSFLLFDLDNFKLFNDTYGHQAGDEALIAIANTLQEALKRGNDYCFRVGGEEFAVLYKSASEHDAYLFAQKIRKNIIALDIKHEKNGDETVLTASFGLITLRDYDLTSDDDIYKRADEYLYRAKKEGRNRIVSRIL